MYNKYRLTSPDRDTDLVEQLRYILWHAEDMARSNISDPTYFTNGKKKSDRRMMLDMKDEFKREIDKI